MPRGRPKKITVDGPVEIADNNFETGLALENAPSVSREEQKMDGDPRGLVRERVVIKDKEGVPEYNLEVIKDYYGAVDIFYLNKKDPLYEYRYLNVSEQNMSSKTSNLLFKHGGWMVVPKKHLIEKMGIKEGMLDALGRYRVGDTVLAFIPKDLWKEKEEKKQEEANAPLKAINRLLESGDSDPSLKPHHTMKGLMTGKQLNMKSE